ncbi:response regulator transcription factor [Paenibacillus xylanexedens]|jgi:DNA-binding NarL/FixJ family response regulator|uniref:response regulator transcription factor n=1 Tax=Paenibacillus xylanexedens TaxID=528191 RepID=UPI0021B41395|nr:LuxR C-terminal-related transcriptional regulator [Paenibacillus xylanexedens]
MNMGLVAVKLKYYISWLLALGNQEIAEALYLSEGTVKNYISAIYSKLNVKGGQAAARKARDSGIMNN